MDGDLQKGYEALCTRLGAERIEAARRRLLDFRLEVPSWGFGRGGTRFASYVDGTEPDTVAERIGSAGRLARLTGQGRTVALHFPWDGPGPSCAPGLKALLEESGVRAGAINANLFTPRPGTPLDHRLRFGSLTHPDPQVRAAAVDHNLECLEILRALGSRDLVLWIPDGSNSPGQTSLYDQADRLEDSLHSIYDALRPGERLLMEYKVFEPFFYSMAVPDWGRALGLARVLGAQAFVLVDTGHHAPGANIEQIITLLARQGRLGGFHLNDRKYADDDLVAGSIDPYQLFRLMATLIEGEARGVIDLSEVAFMIDQSHMIEDPLVDMVQTVENIEILYLKAALLDLEALRSAQLVCDSITANRLFLDAFWTDVRPILARVREDRGVPVDPFAALRGVAE